MGVGSYKTLVKFFFPYKIGYVTYENSVSLKCKRTFCFLHAHLVLYWSLLHNIPYESNLRDHSFTSSNAHG